MAKHWNEALNECGDYIRIKYDDTWFKITNTNEYDFDAVDSFGTEATGLRYDDIEETKLPSEMDYNF